LIVPKGFFPVQDNAAIQAVTEAPQSVSFAAMSERQQALAAKILEDPAVLTLSSFIGIDGTNATLNSGRMLINLKPHRERSESALEIIERMRVNAREVSGITLYLQPVQELTIEDRVSRTQFQFTLTTPDEDLLNEWVPKLVSELQDLPQLSDVASDLQNRGLQAFLEIDRDAASRLGVSVADIDDTLYSAFGQRQVSTLFTQASQYRVVLEVDPRLTTGPEALTSVFVPTRSGRPVPLSSIAHVTQKPATLLINHVGQEEIELVRDDGSPNGTGYEVVPVRIELLGGQAFQRTEKLGGAGFSGDVYHARHHVAISRIDVAQLDFLLLNGRLRDIQALTADFNPIDVVGYFAVSTAANVQIVRSFFRCNTRLNLGQVGRTAYRKVYDFFRGYDLRNPYGVFLKQRPFVFDHHFVEFQAGHQRKADLRRVTRVDFNARNGFR
jgi:hypothetical protein